MCCDTWIYVNYIVYLDSFSSGAHSWHATVGQLNHQRLGVNLLLGSQVLYKLDVVVVGNTLGPELVEGDAGIRGGDLLSVDHSRLFHPLVGLRECDLLAGAFRVTEHGVPAEGGPEI